MILCGIVILGVACQQEEVKTTEKAATSEMDSIFAQLPETRGAVNDFENILSEKEEKLLGEHIARINSNTPFEVVIATSDTITPFEDIMDYATALGNKWAIGDPENNNGLVLMVSSNLGQAAIATGNGIEDVFTDSVSKSIIDRRMIPHFMRGNFYAGLERALREVEDLEKKLDPDR